MMQKLYLIRHGKTVANEQRLYCGKSDLPLSPGGLDELHQLAAKGGYPDPRGCRLCTSGMLRTRQTAEALFGGTGWEELPAFREIDFGVFELQSYDQLKEREDYQKWLEGDNSRNRCPEGESGEDVANRVRPAFDALVADGRDTILIAHGGVIAAILIDLYPDSMTSRYEWQPEPGYGWAVTMDGSKAVRCEPLPDPFLNEEKTLGRKWAWAAAGIVALALVSLMAAAYSAMQQTGLVGVWFGVTAVLLVLSYAVRYRKLRCPYCGKSVAPLKLLSGSKMACPRCGRIYRYENREDLEKKAKRIQIEERTKK